MYFDRFDVCEAYFVFAMDYHGGMGSKEYALHSALDRIKFRPGPCLSEATLSENSKEILARLVSGERKVRDRR